MVREWPGLSEALDAVRAEVEAADADCSKARVRTCCAGTDEQRAYLHKLYRYANRSRFGGVLPDDVSVRLSERMTSSLGHMLPGYDRRRGRVVVEIALNSDLLLEGNGAVRFDTLLHEMAHAADYLFEGEVGHGPTWRAWATFAGCRVETRYDRAFRRRRRGAESTSRVPPLPGSLGSLRTNGAEHPSGIASPGGSPCGVGYDPDEAVAGR